jgi:hypothetical protein
MKALFEKITSKMKKTEEKESDFSLFFHTASSAKRKKVFLKVAKQATLDQRKVLGL